MKVGVLLFEDFETLDVFGPVEILGRLTDLYKVHFYSLQGGLINNMHGVSVQTEKLEEINNGTGIFLIPGGYGTRIELNNMALINAIRQTAAQSSYVLTVCTGTALLARTGLLDGRKATSNKRAFDWVASTGENVNWIKRARWVVDDKYYTSSGVSAGMDMTLGLLNDIHGHAFAKDVAHQIEYSWQEDKDHDDFCKS
ncbi:MAG TPA: DJ-1/PfpI family protein [Chitinophagaceae bacterium]|nr:DJ-1/PfpI family protein [Chitinophagaceae bacterium]